MDLFVELVDTGRRKPAIRHASSVPYLYIYLYTTASKLANERLFNTVLDEVIGWFEDVSAFLVVRLTRCMIKWETGSRLRR